MQEINQLIGHADQVALNTCPNEQSKQSLSKVLESSQSDINTCPEKKVSVKNSKHYNEINNYDSLPKNDKKKNILMEPTQLYSSENIHKKKYALHTDKTISDSLETNKILESYEHSKKSPVKKSYFNINESNDYKKDLSGNFFKTQMNKCNIDSKRSQPNAPRIDIEFNKCLKEKPNQVLISKFNNQLSFRKRDQKNNKFENEMT